ncbi:unannotated protein [freshwater metagenome]|jgi:hypothetical protein|uniref:Unannotated protein n=1 Tax=freshwater metagenome TaxID=449393 RepID=A0A6J7J7K5_9ZZZZ
MDVDSCAGHLARNPRRAGRLIPHGGTRADHPEMDAVTDPALRQLLDSARRADSARSRAGFGALHRHRGEDATPLGLLANLAECNAFVLLSMRGGFERRGTISTAGPGGIEVVTSTSVTSLIRTASISSVRSATRLRLDGDGAPQTSHSWPSLLALRIEHDDQLSVVINKELITGRVRSLSRSLLALDTPDNGVVYAVVEAIDEVSIRVPGSIRQD